MSVVVILDHQANLPWPALNMMRRTIYPHHREIMYNILPSYQMLAMWIDCTYLLCLKTHLMPMNIRLKVLMRKV